MYSAIKTRDMFAKRAWALSYSRSRDISNRSFVTNALSASHHDRPQELKFLETGFVHQKCLEADLTPLQPFFSRLPVDPPLSSPINRPLLSPTKGDRRRRFTRYGISLLNDGSRLVTRVAHEAFVQDVDVNPLAGGIVRCFAPIEPALDDVVFFRSLLCTFQRHAHSLGFAKFAKSDSTIGVHQIRIEARQDHPGVVTPEGFHWDGFRYVGIFCVERGNIEGGVTTLRDFDTSKWKADMMLEPGSLLTFDDRSFEHYTTPITTETNGFRDVFVLTAG